MILGMDAAPVRGSRALLVLGVLVLVAGGAITCIRFAGSSPPETTLERTMAALALGALVAAPGVLALLARFDRAALLLPAATTLALCSVLSVVLFPMLIPAGLLLAAYLRSCVGRQIDALRTAATVVWVQVALVAAGAALLVHADPRSQVTAEGSWGTSDVVTVVESLLSLGLVAAALIGGWRLARGCSALADPFPTWPAPRPVRPGA
jgi:hypothetical protein